MSLIQRVCSERFHCNSFIDSFVAMIKEQASEKDLRDVLLKDCRPVSVQKILQVRVTINPRYFNSMCVAGGSS